MVRVSPAIFLLMLALVLGTALASPSSYIIERTSKNIDYNGTVLNSSNEGSIEVGLDDTRDVLQNVVITLSSASGTNLLNTTAYAAVAASPQIGDRTKLYLSTNVSNETTRYTFSSNSTIDFHMDYANELGGKDLGPGENKVLFSINLSAASLISGVHFNFQASKNTFDYSDSLNIITGNCTSGSTTIVDSDGDGFYDQLIWSGDVSGTVTIELEANITGGVNYDGSELYDDLDFSQTRLNYSQARTFSGIMFSNRFSRASVRQGAEITPKGNWSVRGFMKNIGYGITYRVNGWALYEIGSSTPSAESSGSITLLPGQTTYTSEYNTGTYAEIYTNDTPTSKPIYYAPYFDWEILWGNSIYQGLLEEQMNMPILYQMDTSIDKKIELAANTEFETTLGVTDEIRHLGSSKLEIGQVIFNTSFDESWSMKGILGYKRNGTNITQVNISSVLNSDGNYVIIIDNLSLAQNEIIFAAYNLTKVPDASNRDYWFNMTATGVTKSGTPVVKQIFSDINVPTPLKPPGPKGGSGGGGGGGAAPAPPVLEIIRMDSSDYFATESVLFSNVSYGVIDTGGKGLRNFMFLIYAPESSYIDPGRAGMALTRDGKDSSVSITFGKSQVVKIGDQSYREYPIQTSADPAQALTLYNGDVVRLTYYTDMPFGTSNLITRAYGYNYYEDKYFFEDISTYARREYWNIKNLAFNESLWEKPGVEVGKPVKWAKTIEVQNPNERAVRQMFSTSIMDGFLSVHVRTSENGSIIEIEHSEDGNHTEFLVSMKENANQTYIIEEAMPPVLEIKKDTQIQEIKSDGILFETIIILKNFGRQAYENISYYMPQAEIISSNYNYTQGGENTVVRIPAMKGGENITMNFITKERPPKVIINLDKLRYSCKDDMKLGLIAITDNKNGYMEVELVGPEASQQTIYADIVSIDEMPTSANFTIPITKCLTGNYTLYAFYRSNFQPILTSKENVEIVCQQNGEISWLIFLIISILLIALAIRLIYRRTTLDRELNNLGRE